MEKVKYVDTDIDLYASFLSVHKNCETVASVHKWIGNEGNEAWGILLRQTIKRRLQPESYCTCSREKLKREGCARRPFKGTQE